MLNLIKECLEGTEYDCIKLDDVTCSTSDFFENLKGDFLLIKSDNSIKIINVKAVKEITLKKRGNSHITVISGSNL